MSVRVSLVISICDLKFDGKGNNWVYYLKRHDFKYFFIKLLEKHFDISVKFHNFAKYY